MKKITFIFLLISTITYSQDKFAYVDFSVDPNKILDIVDNNRTEKNNTGLDFDFEIGGVLNNIGVFLYYGRFENIQYQNYGVGLDYYLIKKKKYQVSLGSALSVIQRKKTIDGITGWNSNLGGLGRLIGIIKLTNNLSIPLKLQYQTRPDIDVFGIIEGQIGIRYIFHR